MTSLEIKDAINVAETRCRKIIDICKTEVRDMTEDENKEIEDLKREIEDKKEELKKLEAALEEKPEKEDEEEQEDKKEENSEDEDKKDKNNTQERNMKKEAFSLLRAIRNVANGKALDAIDAAVVKAGAEEMRKGKFEVQGQIQIPSESRTIVVDTYDTGIEHDNVVVTDFTSILEPLHANNVLVDAGCKVFTGCVGDLQVPIMSAANVFWEGEVAPAQDGAPSFSNVKLQPHRLTCFTDISKQFIVQDALSAEDYIRKEIIKAVQAKVEKTVLGIADNNSNKQPAGLFYNVTPTKVTSFAELCDLEAEVEEENFTGEMKYILSPKAKAGLRAMAKSSKHTELVYQGNEIDGTPALETTHIAVNKGDKTFAFGDWSSVAIAQWGGLDLVIDPFSQAANGAIRIVINCFFDAKLLRDNALVYGTLGE